MLSYGTWVEGQKGQFYWLICDTDANQTASEILKSFLGDLVPIRQDVLTRRVPKIRTTRSSILSSWVAIESTTGRGLLFGSYEQSMVKRRATSD